MAAEREVRGRRLLVRADGNSAIGTGHVMRCLALAQAWQDAGGSVTFAMRRPDAKLRQRLEQEKIEVAEIGDGDDAAETVAIGKRLGANWVVVDGYGFGADYQREIQNGGFPVLFVDDYGHGGEYSAELVLNQNISADGSLYARRSSNTRLLLGTRYALLRREFRRQRGFQRKVTERVQRILVSFGGSDPQNVTALVLAALRDLPADLVIKVVVGPANPHRDALRAVPRPGVELLDSADMPQLMAWADLAITAAGSTVSELLYMQLPFVAIAAMENQQRTADCLRRTDLAPAFRLGANTDELLRTAVAELAACERRDELARRFRTLVDDRGSDRILCEMKGRETAGPLGRTGSTPLVMLRPATLADSRMIWEWRNDDQTRPWFGNSEFIPLREHERWFEGHIADDSTAIFVVENDAGSPVGHVRFHRKADAIAEIRIVMAPNAKHRGYGSAAIAAACDRAFLQLGLAQIVAYIKPENEASVRAFRKAGFRNLGIREIDGHRPVEMVLDRSR